ncbi:hypothetical protein scyTo_0020278 [Scyliorhinus torazame]|uniref:InaF motif containing 2 n=1 Tax=Scyliorhinus torazame TaxID=75743 RepID=A0A401PP13_SCYTO|nr:hypothetical protein [Scyliorhinus torazame]
MKNRASDGIGKQIRGPSFTGDKKAKITAKTQKTWMRLATVFAYLLCVSLTAVILVIYYTLIWEPVRAKPGPSNSNLTAINAETGNFSSGHKRRSAINDMRSNPKGFSNRRYERSHLRSTGGGAGDFINSQSSSSGVVHGAVTASNTTNSGGGDPGVTGSKTAATESGIFSTVDRATESGVFSTTDNGGGDSGVTSSKTSATEYGVFSTMGSDDSRATESGVFSSMDSSDHSATERGVFSTMDSSDHGTTEYGVFSTMGSDDNRVTQSGIFSTMDSDDSRATESGVFSSMDSSDHGATESGVFSSMGSSDQRATESGVFSTMDSSEHRATEGGVFSTMDSSDHGAPGVENTHPDRGDVSTSDSDGNIASPVVPTPQTPQAGIQNKATTRPPNEPNQADRGDVAKVGSNRWVTSPSNAGELGTVSGLLGLNEHVRNDTDSKRRNVKMDRLATMRSRSGFSGKKTTHTLTISTYITQNDMQDEATRSKMDGMRFAVHSSSRSKGIENIWATSRSTTDPGPFSTAAAGVSESELERQSAYNASTNNVRGTQNLFAKLRLLDRLSKKQGRANSIGLHGDRLDRLSTARAVSPTPILSSPGSTNAAESRESGHTGTTHLEAQYTLQNFNEEKEQPSPTWKSNQAEVEDTYTNTVTNPLPTLPIT